MKEETLNALDEFLKQVQSFAVIAGEHIPSLRSRAAQLDDAAKDLRDQLQNECI